jgi:hypothetical protein
MPSTSAESARAVGHALTIAADGMLGGVQHVLVRLSTNQNGVKTLRRS